MSGVEVSVGPHVLLGAFPGSWQLVVRFRYRLRLTPAVLNDTVRYAQSEPTRN